MEVVAEREQSVIGEGEARTNGDESPLSRRTASKEEPISSGGESDEERKPVAILFYGDTYPINAPTSRENDLLSIIIDF